MSVEEQKWTFFTNYSHVLFFLYVHPELPLRDVAQAVGITERAVQRIVKNLEDAGVLEKQKKGRQNLYKIRKDYQLRHPLESHRNIGELLAFIQNSDSHEGEEK